MSDETTALQDDEDVQDERVPEPEREEEPLPPPVAAMPRGVAPPLPEAMVPPPIPSSVPGTPAPPPINPAMPPTPPADANPNQASAENPFHALLTREENIHNPVARVAAKVGTHLLGGLAQLSPEVRKEEAEAEERPARQALESAQTRNLNSEASDRDQKANAPPPIKLPKAIGEPVSDGKGGFVIPTQDETTGAVSWTPVSGGPEPAGQPAPPPRTAPAANSAGGGGQTPPATAQPPAFGTKLGERPEKPPEAPKPGEFKPYTVDGKEVLGQQVGNKIIDRGGNDITAKALPFEKEVPDRAADAELRKEAHNYGYSTDQNGATVYTTEAEAAKKGMAFEPMSQADVAKDRQAMALMGNVQLNASNYKRDVNALKADIPTEQATPMASILTDKMVTAKIEPFGAGVDLTAIANVASSENKAKLWNKLTPENQQLVVDYLRAKGAVIGYQRALTNQGRTNPEALQIEFATIPVPYVGSTVANKSFDAFQENIDQVTGRLPQNLPGVPSVQSVRQKAESSGGNAQQGKPAKLVNGVWTDAATGKPIQSK